MLKSVAIAVVGILGVILGLATTRPDTFRVERAIRIKAPPERILAQINDFRNWRGWSPWEAKDPKMRKSYGGAAAGKGAVYEWDGDSSVGKGRMQITESTAGLVRVQLDFMKPMEGHNIAEFTMVPASDATEVTWAMYGPVPYPAKIIQMFVSMDKMVGEDFEAGLANLKTLAEK